MAATAPPTSFLKKRVSQNNGRPWTQDPEYIEACRTIPVPGDPTAYSKHLCTFYENLQS